MLLELRQLRVQPGHQLLLEDVSWQQFENILTELGEHRTARLSFDTLTVNLAGLTGNSCFPGCQLVQTD